MTLYPSIGEYPILYDLTYILECIRATEVLPEVLVPYIYQFSQGVSKRVIKTAVLETPHTRAQAHAQALAQMVANPSYIQTTRMPVLNHAIPYCPIYRRLSAHYPNALSLLVVDIGMKNQYTRCYLRHSGVNGEELGMWELNERSLDWVTRTAYVDPDVRPECLLDPMETKFAFCSGSILKGKYLPTLEVGESFDIVLETEHTRPLELSCSYAWAVHFSERMPPRFLRYDEDIGGGGVASPEEQQEEKEDEISDILADGKPADCSRAHVFRSCRETLLWRNGDWTRARSSLRGKTPQDPLSDPLITNFCEM